MFEISREAKFIADTIHKYGSVSLFQLKRMVKDEAALKEAITHLTANQYIKFEGEGYAVSYRASKLNMSMVDSLWVFLDVIYPYDCMQDDLFDFAMPNAGRASIAFIDRKGIMNYIVPVSANVTGSLKKIEEEYYANPYVVNDKFGKAAVNYMFLVRNKDYIIDFLKAGLTMPLEIVHLEGSNMTQPVFKYYTLNKETEE